MCTPCTMIKSEYYIQLLIKQQYLLKTSGSKEIIYQIEKEIRGKLLKNHVHNLVVRSTKLYYTSVSN